MPGHAVFLTGGLMDGRGILLIEQKRAVRDQNFRTFPASMNSWRSACHSTPNERQMRRRFCEAFRADSVAVLVSSEALDHLLEVLIHNGRNRDERPPLLAERLIWVSFKG